MAECINGRGENHMVTHGPECFYCGQIPTNPFEPLRAALVAIQELHKVLYRTCADEVYELNPVCDNCNTAFPCPTRKLADEGLAGEERG